MTMRIKRSALKARRKQRFHRRRIAAVRSLRCESLEVRRLLAQTPVELTSGLLSISELVPFQNELYFSARGRETPAAPLSGAELWKINAQGDVSLVKDIAPGPGNSSPDELTVAVTSIE